MQPGLALHVGPPVALSPRKDSGLRQGCSECPLTHTACTLFWMQVPILRPWHALLAAVVPVEAAGILCSVPLSLLRPLAQDAPPALAGSTHSQVCRLPEAAHTDALLCFFTEAAGTRYLRRVQLIVIDVEGKRNTLRGLVGQRLIDVLAEHMDELGGDRAPRPAPAAPRHWLPYIQSYSALTCALQASSVQLWPDVHDRLVTRRLDPPAGFCHEDMLGIIEAVLALAEVVGLSPEGRGELEAHVTVPNEWLQQLPPLTDEDKRSLEEIAPYVGRKCARPPSLL